MKLGRIASVLLIVVLLSGIGSPADAQWHRGYRGYWRPHVGLRVYVPPVAVAVPPVVVGPAYYGPGYYRPAYYGPHYYGPHYYHRPYYGYRHPGRRYYR